MQKQLSVIIPVYNGELFIERCLNSVFDQQGIDLEALEVLLINDGSKDGSLTLLQQYKKLHPNSVTVIDQPNMGAAKTRNKGIRMARGTYVALLDQDDYIDNDYFDTFIAAANDGEFDVVQGGFKLVDHAGRIVGQKMPVQSEFGKFLAIPAWAKIHKTLFLKQNAIEFFDNNIGEDNVFTAKEIVSAKKYKTIQYAGYNNAFDNVNNVTNQFHRGLSDGVNIALLLKELSKVQDSDRRLQAMLQYNVARTACYYLLAYGKTATPDRFTVVYKEIFDWLNANNPASLKGKYIFLAPKGELLSARLGVLGLISLHRLSLVRVFAKFYCKGK